MYAGALFNVSILVLEYMDIRLLNRKQNLSSISNFLNGKCEFLGREIG